MKQVTKITVIIAAAVAMMGYQAKALDVIWSAQNGTFVTDQNGAGLPIGDLIRVGNDSANNVAGFTTFGTGMVGDNVGVAGTFADETTTNGTSGFFSSQIYIEVFAGATQSATPVALLTNPTWHFAATDSGSTAIDLNDTGLVIVSGATFVAGGATSPSDIAGGNAVELLVPEPSSMALVVLGLVGGIGLIRRRS